MFGSESQVLKFYDGASVFVTGGTGFLGKVLIEKLLRTCSPTKIYVLVRSKKDKSEQERCEEMFKVPLFDTLREQNPNFASEIKVVPGSLLSKRLGLSEHDRKQLIDEVNVVFHCAASVKFNEHLRVAYESNVQAIDELLDFAQEMPNLKALVHISTFYANCPRTTIDEEFYKPPVTAEGLRDLLKALTDEQITSITPKLIGEWPNTYTFTKCVAEDLIRRRTVNMPVAVIRPSIVISSYKEPMPGWIDNMYGAVGLCALGSLGVVSTAHADPDKASDIVPVDYLVNCILVSAYQACGKNKSNEIATIYNYISTAENKITNGELSTYSWKYGPAWCSVRILWHFTYKTDKYYWVHRIKTCFRHYLPAYIIDFCLKIIGTDPIAVKSYDKIHTFLDALRYFGTREWYASNQHTQDLWSELGGKDKELFPFSMGCLDWDEYFKDFPKGIRIYLVKDPLQTLAAGRRKLFYMRLLHYAMHTNLWLLICLFVRFIYLKTCRSGAVLGALRVLFQSHPKSVTKKR